MLCGFTALTMMPFDQAIALQLHGAAVRAPWAPRSILKEVVRARRWSCDDHQVHRRAHHPAAGIGGVQIAGSERTTALVGAGLAIFSAVPVGADHD